MISPQAVTWQLRLVAWIPALELSNTHDAQTDPNNTSRVATVREGQRVALALPDTAMSVNMETGVANDWHFPNKPEAGRRLALPARAKVYGETGRSTLRSRDGLVGGVGGGGGGFAGAATAGSSVSGATADFGGGSGMPAAADAADSGCACVIPRGDSQRAGGLSLVALLALLRLRRRGDR